MKALFLSFALLSIFSTTLAHAGTHAVCQTKLLKVASEALEKNFAPLKIKVGEINEITYNYGLEGQPRVIFICQSGYYADQVCLIDVRTTAGEETDTTCPDYKFSEMHTTCQGAN